MIRTAAFLSFLFLFLFASSSFAGTVELQQHTLTVSKLGEGSGAVSSSDKVINCDANCTGNYQHGKKVTLKEKPDANSYFVGWAGDCGAAGTKSSCTLTMDSDKNATANFLPNPTLTLTKSGDGNGNVKSAPKGIDCGVDCTTGDSQFKYKAKAKLTAKADQYSTFLDWSGDACSGITKPTCKVSMDASKNVTAQFGLPDISVSPTTHDFGDVEIKTRSEPATFTIINNGIGDLKITKMEITGTDAKMFKKKGGGKKTIKPGASLDFSVTFKPTTTGAKTATLRITSNDPDGAVVEISLSGGGGAGGDGGGEETIVIPTMITDSAGNVTTQIGSTKLSATINDVSSGIPNPIAGFKVDVITNKTDFYILLSDPEGVIPPLPIAFNINDIFLNTQQRIKSSLSAESTDYLSCGLQLADDLFWYVVSIIGDEIKVLVNLDRAHTFLEAVESTPILLKKDATDFNTEKLFSADIPLGVRICKSCSLNTAMGKLETIFNYAGAAITVNTIDLAATFPPGAFLSKVVGVLVSTGKLFLQMQSVIYCFFGYSENDIFDWYLSGVQLRPVPILPVLPDTTPPSLVSSNPFNDAINIPVTQGTISFTFNEPMGMGYSFSWSGVNINANDSNTSWSEDKKTIFLTLADLPANSTITWILNPSTLPPGFTDLAGNPLPTTAGSFTTAEEIVYPDIPTVPTRLTATAVSSSQIDLSWNASTSNVGISGYKVYRNGSYLMSVNSTFTSDTGLSPSSQYCYRVTAYNIVGNESGTSEQACAITFSVTPPPPPETIDGIVIEWTQLVQADVIGVRYCNLRVQLKNTTDTLKIVSALTYNAFDSSGNGIGWTAVGSVISAKSTVVAEQMWVSSSLGGSVEECSSIADYKLDRSNSYVY